MTTRRRRRRRKARQGSTATHISSLGEDLVLEIFLRLPSLATLVRAALTCRAWRRAVASSPDFWRRFRALHPAPPLLGIFFNGIDICDPPPCVCGSCSCTLRASVFSSETGEWSAVPLVDVPARSEDDAIDHSFDEADRAEEDGSDAIWIDDEWKMQAKGSIYWIYKWRGHRRDGSYLISLDTIAMEFSFAKLPQCLRSPDWRFTLDAGGTEDGAACIVYSDGYSNVGVVKHTRGDDGVERWVLDRVHRLELDGELQGINLGEFSGLAVRDGYAYFSDTGTLYDPRNWFMSLCLATMKVEKLFESTYDGHGHHALATLLVSW